MDRLTALIPPPRRHRHRYYGVLAPSSPLRPAVTALAAAPKPPPAEVDAVAQESPLSRAARIVWATLLARTYEVFPLTCPKCFGRRPGRMGTMGASSLRRSNSIGGSRGSGRLLKLREEIVHARGQQDA